MHGRQGIQALDARRADAAARLVDRASQRDRVRRVVERLQVRHRVLDLGTLVEAGAADHLVGDAVTHQQVLEDARLRVRPVEDRDVSRGDALVEQAADARGDEARLGLLVLHLDHADRLALAEVGPEALLEAVRVVCDDGVRRIQDPLRRAVVLLEPDHHGVGEVALEVEDVADVGAAERVHRLVGVADREQVPMRADRSCAMRYCAWLVSWYSSISRCVNTSCQRSRTSSKRSSRSTVRTSRSSKSIAFDWCSRRSYSTKTSATVCSKKPFDLLAELGRRHEAVLLGRDARVDAARREPLRVAIELLEARAHEPHLVRLVVDREVRPVAEPIGVAAQDPPARRVERQHPHAARGPDELLDPLAHLAGRSIGEGDREHLVWLHLALGQQVGDTARQHARLSRAQRRRRRAPARPCASRPRAAAGSVPRGAPSRSRSQTPKEGSNRSRGVLRLSMSDDRSASTALLSQTTASARPASSRDFSTSSTSRWPSPNDG